MELEELVIIQHSLDSDLRGFLPKLSIIRDMANKLLTVRGQDNIGIQWPSNFIKWFPELQVCFNRKYDYQRALTEDPKTIQQWFEYIQTVIAMYEIQEKDIFNFDKTGFMIGIASTAKVVIASNKSYRLKIVQPGNRKWVTVIQRVNAQGWAIPPFIILTRQHHLSA